MDGKLQYDLVVGFGKACSCSQTLRRAGLQFLSFPMDWITPTFGQPGWDHDLRHRADVLASGFGGWLRIEDFEFHGNHTNGMGKYWNTRHGLMFLHDFPADVPLNESFPSVAAKYARREKRLLGLIGKSSRVLIARLDRPDLDYRTPLDDCRYARELLSKTFAPTTFDLLLVQPDPGVPPERASLETVEPGIFRLSFAYRDIRPGADAAIPRLDLTSAVVERFFSVREYRTAEEIAAHRAKKRQKRWAKYGATSAWQYHWRKLLAHFRKGASRASS